MSVIEFQKACNREIAFHKYMIQEAWKWDYQEQVTHTLDQHFKYFMDNIYKGDGDEAMCDECKQSLYNCTCHL